MKKLIQRLLLFFLGLPLVISSVFFLPQYNYLFLQIELIAVTILASLELHGLIKQRLPVHNRFFAVFLGLLLPLAAVLHSVLDLPFRLIDFSLALGIIAILSIEFFTAFSGVFDKAIGRIASSLFLLLYPGFLFMFIPLMTVWDMKHAGPALSLFLLMVFSCDSLAWFFGMLFGKNNRGLVPASPNKSITGFIGAYIGSLGAGLLAWALFPEIFGSSPLKLLLLGAGTASAAIVGDIVESIMKRSAMIKDSGNLVPGRGGVLDSIDSVVFAAPVYYILCDILFRF